MSIAIANTTTYVEPSAGTSHNVTIPSTTAGNMLILLACNGGQNRNAMTSLSLSGVNFTKQIGVQDATANRCEIWSLANIAGGLTTLVLGKTTNYGGKIFTNILEVSGVDSSAVIDPTAASATGVTAAISSGTLTPASSNSVLFLAATNVASATYTAGPTNSWNSLPTTGFDTSVSQAYLIATGSTSVGYTQSTSYRAWLMAMMGVDAAAVGGGASQIGFGAEGYPANGGGARMMQIGTSLGVN